MDLPTFVDISMLQTLDGYLVVMVGAYRTHKPYNNPVRQSNYHDEITTVRS